MGLSKSTSSLPHDVRGLCACLTLAATGDSCWLGTFEILSAPLRHVFFCFSQKGIRYPKRSSEFSNVSDQRSVHGCSLGVRSPSVLRIPLAKILGPPLLAETSTAHKWISKALDSEKRYLALFDQERKIE